MEKEIALLHRQWKPTFMASWLSLRSIPCSTFLWSHPIPSGWLPTVNRSPHPGIILQSPWLQLPASVDTSGLTTLSEVWKAATWLVCVVLIPFRLSQISEFTPQQLQMTPPSQWTSMDAGISLLCFSSLSPRCRLVPLALLLLSPSSLSLLSFVQLSSVWIQIFLLSSQGVLPVFTWSSVRTAASLDVPDASVERGVPTSSYPSVILSTPICTCIRN